MIILDNVAKQYGVDESFKPFTEKIQLLFDELKEKFPGIIRINISNEILLLEKEIEGLSGVIEELPMPEGLLDLIEESFIVDPVETAQIEEVDFEHVPLDMVIFDGVEIKTTEE